MNCEEMRCALVEVVKNIKTVVEKNSFINEHLIISWVQYWVQAAGVYDLLCFQRLQPVKTLLVSSTPTGFTKQQRGPIRQCH